MDGYGIGALYEYKLDLDTGRWSPRKWWWLGHSHPTREVRGFMIHGQQTHTLGGHRYLFSCHKTIRIYRFDGDRLVPVARVGSRLRFYDGKGKLARSKTAFFPGWVDRNGDGLATEEEVEEVPLGEVGKGRRFPIEPHIGFSHDAEVDRRGTVYWGNFALPLEKNRPTGSSALHLENRQRGRPRFQAAGQQDARGSGGPRAGAPLFRHVLQGRFLAASRESGTGLVG
ncbi:MAG: hypothetical protein Ct9H300mP1_19250 [Planctomycetaceae bacterium]|nr:MAG: hypothetical protein Ct9H300mP1_19250 [Planctomycetaceae bacterium]